VVRIEGGGSGLAARTIARRLSTVSGLLAYLAARGDVGAFRDDADLEIVLHAALTSRSCAWFRLRWR
jgi:site-specific recombinase XerC